MELNYYTAPFKNTKFEMRDAYTMEEIQKAMFKMGFRFDVTKSGEVREVRNIKYKTFYIDEDLRIWGSLFPMNTPHGFAGRSPYKCFKEVKPLEVLEASKLFMQLKAKKQRIRKMQKRIDRTNARLATEDAAESQVTVSLDTMLSNIVRDAGGVEVDKDGWIKWEHIRSERDSIIPKGKAGGAWAGPVPHGTLVDIKLRDGKEFYGKKAGTVQSPVSAAGAFWMTDGVENDIVAYRLSHVIRVDSLSAINANDIGHLSVKPAGWAEVGSVTDYGDMKPDTNPKKQYGLASVPLNMWSQLASAYGSLALYNGSLKYGKANFANTPVEASIYIAAAMRHLAAWAAGEEFDPADGVPNLGGVLANIAILLESRAAGMLIDDRLKMDGYLKERDALKEIVKSLTALHAGKDPKHYTLEG